MTAPNHLPLAPAPLPNSHSTILYTRPTGPAADQYYSMGHPLTPLEVRSDGGAVQLQPLFIPWPVVCIQCC